MPPSYIKLALIIFRMWFGFALIYFGFILLQSSNSINIIALLIVVLIAYMGSVILFANTSRIIEFFKELGNPQSR